MTPLRPELARLVEQLATRAEVTLDAVGEAIGARAVSLEEVDEILNALEARGVRVLSPEGGGGEGRLRDVVGAARALASELGRPPRLDEIAARSGLSESDVRHALALARVIQR
jgi:hypothetical protein